MFRNTLVILLVAVSSVCFAKPQTAIVCAPDADAKVVLAAREIQRYVYLRTGELLPVLQTKTPPDDRDVIVVGTVANKRQQEYVLETFQWGHHKMVSVAGGDEVGTLYGAYRLIEHLGVRFFMHGDVVPDKQIPLKLPDVKEHGKPLFAMRGVNPWGSHPFGFDQWSADDYKVHIGQLAKMRMNFIGMHCYPEGHPYAEPTVWLGTAGDFDKQGNVKHSYPARYYNTLWKGRWGPMLPKKTGDFSFGASQLFERDDWGPDVMTDLCPTPSTPASCNELFNRTARQFDDAFTFARLVGVKTCIGTEAPMIMPKALQERLKAQGKNPRDPAVVQEVYEGIFRRIMASHPLDYYWIWTPEGWTWRGNTLEQMKMTVDDVKIAMAALKKVDAPFKLATCGWVLGPKGDRAAFDRMVPKEIAVSAISRVIGYEPVDPAFGEVTGRQKWAIPWLESDDFLASPQLWVGRTRKDAADALAYKCDGLMGLQWRTRVIGPNVAAMAAASWDQSGWNPSPGKLPPNTPLGKPNLQDALGGKAADYPGREIAGTDDDAIYQTCRYDLRGYHLKVPNATYRVTLKFCEPHFTAAGKRVCDIKLQGKTVIEKLDIFGKVGSFVAFDQTFDNVKVTDGRLRLDIVYRESLPCISGIAIEGKDFTKKINCGGPAYKDYVADAAAAKPPVSKGRGVPRGLPTGDFYADWANALFGSEAADGIAAVFVKIDGKLPHSLGGGCPSGSLRSLGQPWEQMTPTYAFVDELAAFRPKVKGAGNLERFDYWLNTFRYLRAQAQVQCTLGQFDAAMKNVTAEKDPAKRKQLARSDALPLYKELVRQYGEMVRLRLAAVTTYGGIATVLNLEHQAKFFPTAITGPGQRLAQALGGPLPEDARPSKKYEGPARLIVPTVRTSIAKGEELKLKVIVLASEKPSDTSLYWRQLGTGKYNKAPLKHIARGVYTVSFPPGGATSAIEYYIEAKAGNKSLHFPATAPQLNQTLVLLPADQP